MKRYIIKHPYKETYAGMDRPSGGYPYPTNNINSAFITNDYNQAKDVMDLCQGFDNTLGFTIFELIIDYIPV